MTALLAPLGLPLAGCTPVATFPPVPGSTTIEPWVAPMPEVMALGIERAHRIAAPDAPVIYNLPPGVPQWVWENVQSRLPEGARPMTAEDLVVFSVEQVRVDGAKAEADVLYPVGDDVYQLMTVGMEGTPFQPWRVVFVRKFRIPTSPPSPNWGIWPYHESRDYPNMNPPPWETGAPPPPLP